MRIRKLAPEIVNRIAAGEVIARPASVVKELVENSLDADSTHIEIAIEEGGKKNIRITDNGAGINSNDLTLAFESHATSKLKNDEHLFHIATLGFRGEALASIGSIAQVTLRSKTADSDNAWQLYVDGTKPGTPEPVSGITGTSIEVRNLFFNTPARRKFLKADATELGHITDIVTRLALAHPHVQFILSNNGREIFNLPAHDNLRERIRFFYSDQVSNELIEINRNENTITLHGYIAPLQETRRNNSMQFIYLNGRHIRDKVIMHALRNAFDGVVMPGRYPIAFLFIDMDPGEVDVNVHPTKSEVRFRASGIVHSIIVHAIRSAVSNTEHPTELVSNQQKGFQPFETNSDPKPETMQRALSAYLNNQQQHEFGQKQFVTPAPPIGSMSDSIDSLSERPFHSPASVEHGVVNTDAATVSYQQLFNTYILEETPEGICMTDQHALHERILYEEICARVADSPLECQKLLIPETVHFDSETEVAALVHHAEQFWALGFDIEAFEGKTLVIQAVPKMLKNFNAQELFKQLARDIEKENPTIAIDKLADHIIATMACKAAVKAGDKLTQEEMRYLIENKAQAFLRHSCPHGRPTALFMSLHDIERQFRRIV